MIKVEVNGKDVWMRPPPPHRGRKTAAGHADTQTGNPSFHPSTGHKSLSLLGEFSQGAEGWLSTSSLHTHFQRPVARLILSRAHGPQY